MDTPHTFASLACLVPLIALGCSASNDGAVFNEASTTSSAAGAGGAAAVTSTSGAGGGLGGGFGVGGGTGGSGVELDAEVYGHSPDVLYKLDPVTKTFKPAAEIAKRFGEINLYVGDDGKIHA